MRLKYLYHLIPLLLLIPAIVVDKWFRLSYERQFKNTDIPDLIKKSGIEKHLTDNGAILYKELYDKLINKGYIKAGVIFGFNSIIFKLESNVIDEYDRQNSIKININLNKIDDNEYIAKVIDELNFYVLVDNFIAEIKTMVDENVKDSDIITEYRNEIVKYINEVKETIKNLIVKNRNYIDYFNKIKIGLLSAIGLYTASILLYSFINLPLIFVILFKFIEFIIILSLLVILVIMALINRSLDISADRLNNKEMQNYIEHITFKIETSLILGLVFIGTAILYRILGYIARWNSRTYKKLSKNSELSGKFAYVILDENMLKKLNK